MADKPARRKPLISGNWKMHNNHFEAIQLVQKLSYALHKDVFDTVDVTVHPPFTDIRSVQTVIDADTGAVRATVQLGGEVGNVVYDTFLDQMVVAVQGRNDLAVIDPSVLL